MTPRAKLEDKFFDESADWVQWPVPSKPPLVESPETAGEWNPWPGDAGEALVEAPPAPTPSRESPTLTALDQAKERDAQSRLFRALEQGALTAQGALGGVRPAQALTEPTNEAERVRSAQASSELAKQAQTERMRQLEFLEGGRREQRDIDRVRAQSERMLGLERIGMADTARQEAATQKAAELELRRAALEAQSSDRALDRASRDRAAADANALRLELERMRSERLGQVAEAKAAEKAAAAATRAEQGRALPATVLNELASLPVAVRASDDLVDTFRRLKMGTWQGRGGEVLTDAFGLRGTDAAEYQAAALRAMQAAGSILEGGKLAAGDELKYRRMLPRPGDSEAVLTEKQRGMRRFLSDLFKTRTDALRAGGFAVPDSLMPQATKPTQRPASPGATPQPSQPPSQSSDSADAEQLRAFIRDSPNDPRIPRAKAALAKIEARMRGGPR